MKRSPQTLLVSKSAGGEGWTVSRPGGAAKKTFPTKLAAVKAAHKMACEDGGLLTIKNADGRVARSFTLGRMAMTKLNAVEGVVLGRAGREAFKAFDRTEATPAQRRSTLKKDLASLVVGTRSAATPRGGSRKRSKA